MSILTTYWWYEVVTIHYPRIFSPSHRPSMLPHHKTPRSELNRRLIDFADLPQIQHWVPGETDERLTLNLS